MADSQSVGREEAQSVDREKPQSVDREEPQSVDREELEKGLVSNLRTFAYPNTLFGYDIGQTGGFKR